MSFVGQPYHRNNSSSSSACWCMCVIVLCAVIFMLFICFIFRILPIWCTLYTKNIYTSVILRNPTNLILNIHDNQNELFSKKSDSATNNCIWLRLGLSHLRDNKFKHGFLDSLNPICSCGLDVEITCHYLLHCPNFTNERSILLNMIQQKTKIV